MIFIAFIYIAMMALIVGVTAYAVVSILKGHKAAKQQPPKPFKEKKQDDTPMEVIAAITAIRTSNEISKEQFNLLQKHFKTSDTTKWGI